MRASGHSFAFSFRLHFIHEMIAVADSKSDGLVIEEWVVRRGTTEHDRFEVETVDINLDVDVKVDADVRRGGDTAAGAGSSSSTDIELHLFDPTLVPMTVARVAVPHFRKEPVVF